MSNKCVHEWYYRIVDIVSWQFFCIRCGEKLSMDKFSNHASDLEKNADALNARIAELEAENAELKERVAMLDVTAVFKSLGEMGYIEQTNKLHARIAELEATVEIHADISNAYEKRISEIVSLSNKANAKLQSRIAELEAAQRWTPVSERLPEEDTDGNTLMVICRHSGEWVRAPFGAEFADEFVRHYTHWMYAPQPPEVTG